jgi:hypothetical protein
VTRADPVRIGIKTSPQDTDWPTLDATWARVGEHDVFQPDHRAKARLGFRPLPDLMTMRGRPFGGMMDE